MHGLLIPLLLAACLSGCMEGPPGKDGTDGDFPPRDSIILDYKAAWEYHFLHHPGYAGDFELSEAELEVYRSSDTAVLRRDSSANALFAVTKYAPREWAVYYEISKVFKCAMDTATPAGWVARFKEASSYCTDPGDPYVPTKGSALIRYYEGRGFDISNYFIWEEIPIGKIRIYYW